MKIINTTKEPENTTSQPINTTAKIEETTSTLVDTAIKPVQETQDPQPVETTRAPTSEVNDPIVYWVDSGEVYHRSLSF